MDWRDLLPLGPPDLKLFFEVGLPSPIAFKTWLSEHLNDRHALRSQLAVAKSKGDALEGHTHLDALLLSQTSGFALHVEAKVLSDLDTHITYDSLRNQLARNIDCMAAPAAEPPCSERAIRTAASW